VTADLIDEVIRDAAIHPSERPGTLHSHLRSSEKATLETNVTLQETRIVPAGLSRNVEARYLSRAGTHGTEDGVLIDLASIGDRFDVNRPNSRSGGSDDVISSWAGEDEEERAYRDQRVQLRLRDEEPFEHLSYYAEDRTKKPELLLKRALRGAGNFVLNLDVPFIKFARELGSDIKESVDYLPDQIGKQTRENPWKGSGDVRVTTDELRIGIGERQKLAGGVENELLVEGGVRRVPGAFNSYSGDSESFCEIAYSRRF
jgi:hypothetical protein